MSSINESKLKRVSSSDSIFSNDSEYENTNDNQNIFNVLKSCRSMKKGDDIIELIVEFKTLLEDNKDNPHFEVDLFYQFDNLFFLFSKKDKKIMPYLDDVTSVFIKNIHEWAIPDVIDTLIYGLSNESYKGDDVKSIRKEFP